MPARPGARVSLGHARGLTPDMATGDVAALPFQAGRGILAPRMSALAASLVVAAATAALAIVGTYFTTRRNLEATFDTSLRDLRIAAYTILWKDLEALAKYARPEPLTRQEAAALAATLKTWYFETGGLYLSERTRQDYFALLDGLETVVAGVKKRLRPEDDEFLRVLGSRLRTGMTGDVGTRRTYPFRAMSDGDAPAERTFTAPDGRRLVIRGQRRFVLFGPRGPSLEVDGVRGGDWDPARRAFSVRPTAGGPDDERLFLLEAAHVVEGPKGWERWATEARRGTTVWREGVPEA